MKKFVWTEGCIKLDAQTTEGETITIFRHEDDKTYLSVESDFYSDNEAVFNICLESLLGEMIEKGLLVIGLNIQ